MKTVNIHWGHLAEDRNWKEDLVKNTPSATVKIGKFYN